MKRFALAAVLGLVASLLLVSAARAAKPGQFVSGDYTYFQIDRMVEPYWFDADPTNTVWNPTQCAWDTDDHFSPFPGSGYLAGNQEVIGTACFVAVENPPRGFAGGYALHPNYHFHVEGGPVTVWACFPAQGWCGDPVTTSTTFDGCWVGPQYNQDSPYTIEIPDSNGGFGVPSTWVIHMLNPSTRRSPMFTVYAEGGNDQNMCPTQPYNWFSGPGWAAAWQ